MNPVRTSILPMLAAMLVACGGPAPETGTATPAGATDYLTAASLGEQVVLPTADYLKLPRYRNADRDYGRNLAMQCRMCHSFEPGESSPLGPSLHALFGRRAGSVDDYAYSSALAEADFVWTPQALDGWIAAPWRFLPGNRMAYAGVQDQAARDALIAALLQLTEPKAADDGA